MTKELITDLRAEAVGCRDQDGPGSVTAVLLDRAADALSRAAVPDAATEIARNLANATALTGQDARVIAEAAVMVAAAGEIAEDHARCDGRLLSVEKHAERMEVERDAALAAIERIRQAVSGHPECDRYEDGDVISCGWKSAYASVVAALDGAPEPEGRWEYRGRLQSCGYVAEGYISAEHAMNGLKVELEDHPYLQMDDTAIVERARVREWLPVEGEKP